MSKIISNLSDVTPIYKIFKGWDQPITSFNSYQDLPEKTKRYIQFISDFIGVPIKIISTGPARNEIIHIN